MNGTISFPEVGEWVVKANWQGEGDVARTAASQMLTVNEVSGMFGWAKDYSGGTQKQAPEAIAPVGVTIILSRAPLLDEPFELKLAITAIRDLDAAEVGLRLIREKGTTGREKISVEDILVEGVPVWRGALKENTPVEYPLIVKFPEEGDWNVIAWSRASPEAQTNYMH
ncbi:hypothetical protein ACFLVF_02400 [Chloroflexota bacterium]